MPRPGSKILAGTANPHLRLFTVPEALRDTPQTDIAQADIAGAQWQQCGPETVGKFSAVAYYFGRDLQQALQVPVGLIHASYGGSSVTHWVASPALPARPGLRQQLQQQRQPRLYNGMIAPLVPYGMRGVIWYQGEADTSAPERYQALFSTLIQSWRTTWGQGDFPFLFVQIAPYGRIVDQPQESAWAQVREAQRLTNLSVGQTAMVVITDCGHEADIHPQPKEPVGARLALAARKLVYHQELVATGPAFAGMRVADGRIVLDFEHTGGGLESHFLVLEDVIKNPRTGETGGALHVRPGTFGEAVPLQGFTIAGKDRKFVNAQAQIRGNQVLVWSGDVAEPVAVRYGWADYPIGNLYNREGLPASPFRTDVFPFPPVKPAVRGR